MKKILAIILISLMLITSCAEIDDSKNAGGTSAPEQTTAVDSNTFETEPSETSSAFPNVFMPSETKLAEYLVIGDCAPYPIPNTNKYYQWPDISEFTYMVKIDMADGAEKLYDAIVSTKLDIKHKIRAYYPVVEKKIREGKEQCKKACFVDKQNSEAYKAYFEALTSVDYEKYYSDDFFDKNVLFFTDISEGVWPEFCMFEYSFDPATKTLYVNARHIYFEGWEHCRHDSGHTYYTSIAIPKEDITVDGKMIPLEELNVEFTGSFAMWG